VTAAIAPGTLRQRLDAGLEQLGLDADGAQREALLTFVRLLERWNQAFNLTAVRDPREMVPRHLLDSLSVSPYLHGDRVLDVGTGAGLPGIPLAVLHPRRRFWLLDSNGKKVRFVRQAAAELGLANVAVVQARVESYPGQGKFATIVSRAVTSLAELADSAEPLAARPACLLVMKGRYPRDELAALDPRTGPVLVHPLRVPFLDGERHLIEIRYD
jgi:16S rRNA (guanine527-N7)-methyltransferase